MKRWPPFNQPDGTPWTNGNPAVGERGSIIEARAIDHAQAEIVNAITRLGLSPDANDLHQLGKAIENYVAALTGAGDTALYVTISAARSTLPFYPDVTTQTGRLTITSPSAGTVFVSPEGAILHRGIHTVAMSGLAEIDRTFNVLPSKTAHLRWSPSLGLTLRYLDDATYNPSGLSEQNSAFDSGFDDALLARVSTNASAVVTILPLTNRHQLWRSNRIAGSATVAGSGYRSFSATEVLNWARTPQFRSVAGAIQAAAVSPPGTMDGTANFMTPPTVSRYSVAAAVSSDWTDDAVLTGPTGYIDFNLGA